MNVNMARVEQKEHSGRDIAAADEDEKEVLVNGREVNNEDVQEDEDEEEQIDEAVVCSVYLLPKQWSRRFECTFFTLDVIEVVESPSSSKLDVKVNIVLRCANKEWRVSPKYSEIQDLLIVFGTEEWKMPFHKGIQEHETRSLQLPFLPTVNELTHKSQSQRVDTMNSFLQQLLNRPKSDTMTSRMRQFVNALHGFFGTS